MMLNWPGKFIVLYIFVVITLIVPSNAQSPFSNTKNLTVYDGLSNNKVTVIFQDSRGFLWIGTEDGLNRYDGYRMVVYRHEPFDTTSISGNLIQAINETPDGNIWVGTKNYGLNIWDRKTDSFTHYINNPNNPNSLPENEVCGILVTKYSSVWIKTRNYLVSYVSGKRTFDAYGHFTNLFKPEKNYRYPLLEEKDGVIWVGTKDGLNKFDLIDKTFERIIDRDNNYDVFQDLITDLIRYNDSTLLMATPSNVIAYNVYGESFIQFFNSFEFREKVGITNVVYKGREGKFWLGTKMGLRYFEEEFKNQPLVDQDLKFIKDIDDEVTSIYEDKSKILWVGTKHKGLYKFDQGLPKFSTISVSDNSYSLPTYNIKSLILSKQGDLWLGTSGKGVFVLNRHTGKIKHHPLISDNNLISEDVVHALYSDSKGNIWIGTNHGLYVYDEASKLISEFDYCGDKEFSTLLKDNEIRAITEDELNNIWIGTKFGLYKYNNKSLECYFSEPKDTNSLCDDDIFALMNDKDGWLWIGTKKGINIYKPSEGRFTRLQNSSSKPMLLSNDYILSLADDANGNVWIGTRTGLTQYNKLNHTTKNYLKKDGLANDVINGVLTDDMGRVWVSTNKGLSLIGINGNILNFSTDDGLAGYVFNIGSVHKSTEGELFFGGFEGVSYLYPGLIELNLVQPNVEITSISLVSKGDITKTWTGEVGEIVFKYQMNSSLRVEYSGLEFTQPQKNRYRVFLDGFDENWRPVTYQNSVTYSNLPPGKYTLKIKGANSDFLWNNSPRLLEIEIESPLWRSNYAYAFYIIAFIFLLQAIINFRVRYYRKAYQSLKEKAVDKKKIEAQKEALSKINKSLTDSINYAKRIQEGMLPSDQMVKSLINESFIYYRPKDIVSGDFYYFFKRGHKLFMAAVDCTGHGVPGAFMSIIGYDLIRNIIEIQGEENPATVLNDLNRQLLEVFKKDQIDVGGLQYEVNDGMDMALVVVDYNKEMIEFAGANNSLYIVRDNEIENYNGNRYPIGYNDSRDLFTSQDIPFSKNDVAYIFSDGYVDQFGGPEGKKFKYRRFRHLLLNIHKLPFEDQKAILHQKMEEWMGTEHEQIDDMLLIGCKMK